MTQVLVAALRNCWRTSPRMTTATVASQLSIALLVLAQVLLVRWVLLAVLGAGGGAAGTTGTTAGLVLPLVLLVLAGVAGGLVAASAARQARLLADRVATATLSQVLRVAEQVPLQRFEDASFYEGVEHVVASATTKPLAAVRGLASVLGGAAAVAVLVVVLLALDPLLPLLVVLAAGPLWLLSRAGSRREVAFSRAEVGGARLRGYLIGLLTDRSAAQEVRSFGLADHLHGRWDDSQRAYLHALDRHARARQFLAVGGALVSASFLVGALLYLVWRVRSGASGLADAGAAVVAVRLLSTRVGQLTSGVAGVHEAALFLEDYEGFLADPANAPEGPGGDRPVPENFAVLTVQGLGYTYPGAPAPSVVDVDLELRAGELVAVVGENGSGKTTLSKLVAGLYPPTTGSLQWDGVDVARFRREELRRRTSVIFQDFERYRFSAFDNIHVGDLQASDASAAVLDAARRSGADQVLSRLARGYDTVLSREFDGTEVSGGEWQRVAIARGIVRPAALTILDEPTAALDPRAERDLYEALRGSLSGRTVLMVSHRLAAVRSADRIVVMHRGRVVEQGTHDELVHRGGRYAEMWALQASGYRDDVALTAP